MSAREQIVRDLHEHIQSTLELVRSHRDALIPTGTSLPSAGPPAVDDRTAPPPLSVLAERDRQIIQELMRLQRTLSRQSFRGAESARRLVRRLVRRAQQNVDALERWQAGPESPVPSAAGEEGDLGALLAEISHSLIQLQHAGEAFYNQVGRAGADHDTQPPTP